MNLLEKSSPKTNHENGNDSQNPGEKSFGGIKREIIIGASNFEDSRPFHQIVRRKIVLVKGHLRMADLHFVRNLRDYEVFVGDIAGHFYNGYVDVCVANANAVRVGIKTMSEIWRR